MPRIAHHQLRPGSGEDSQLHSLAVAGSFAGVTGQQHLSMLSSDAIPNSWFGWIICSELFWFNVIPNSAYTLSHFKRACMYGHVCKQTHRTPAGLLAMASASSLAAASWRWSCARWCPWPIRSPTSSTPLPSTSDPRTVRR